MRYIPWVLRRVIDAGLEGRPGAEEFIASGGWDALRGRWGSWEGRGRPPVPLRALGRRLLGWHPYFWAALLAGNFRGVIADTIRRLFPSGPAGRR